MYLINPHSNFFQVKTIIKTIRIEKKKTSKSKQTRQILKSDFHSHTQQIESSPTKKKKPKHTSSLNKKRKNEKKKSNYTIFISVPAHHFYLTPASGWSMLYTLGIKKGWRSLVRISDALCSRPFGHLTRLSITSAHTCGCAGGAGLHR